MLQIYDPALDCERPATQDDIHRLVRVQQAHGLTRELLRKMIVVQTGAVFNLDEHIEMLHRMVASSEEGKCVCR